MMTPTVLIGLGGLGSTVVNQVYSMASPQERKNLAVHGFDTDAGSIERLGALRGHVTQIGGGIPVANALIACGNPHWFPLPATERARQVLGRKPLDQGAGQIRSVSALAWMYTMARRGGMVQLERDIDQLFRVSGFTLGVPRVYIVSSLAGGTGSGIFLQTAFYTRHLIESIYRQSQYIVVEGIFFLPDVVTGTVVGDSDQANRTRANAYACLKELNGMLTLLDGDGLEFEYMAGQQNPKIDGFAYDSVLLIDRLNSAGQGLGDSQYALSRYLDQAARIVFTRLTPTGAPIKSNEDNFLAAAMANNGGAMYKSAGFSRLVYPYEDIARYCGARMLEKSLEGQWLTIDRLFAQELKLYEQQLAQGIYREHKPRLPNFFIKRVDELGDPQKSKNPFFRAIYRQTHDTDAKGRPTQQPLHALFLEAIGNAIDAKLKADTEYQDYAARPLPREDELQDQQQALVAIRKFQGVLEDMQDYVERIVQENANAVLYEVMREEADHKPGDGPVPNDDFRLNTWLLRKPEAMHPLAIRYFLYQIEETLERELPALRSKNKKLEASIEGYAKVFDVVETTDEVEDLEGRIRYELDRKGRFLKLFGGGRLKTFINDVYLSKARSQKTMLIEYARSKLRENVLSGLLVDVKGLSQIWKDFFDGLNDTQHTLRGDIAKMETEHDYSTGPAEGLDTTQGGDRTCFYIGADRKRKNQLWDVLQQTELDAQQMATLWDALYKTIYKYYAAREWNSDYLFNAPPPRQEDLVAPMLDTMTGVFKAHAQVNRTLPQIMDDLATQVFAANPSQRLDGLKAIVDRVKSGAEPWIEPDTQADARNQYYWSVHKEAGAQQNDWEARFGAVAANFFPQTISAVVADEDNSPYELTCYQSLYKLRLTDLPKFQEGGAYTKAYQAITRAVQFNPNYPTSHLYTTWDTPGVLPEISEKAVNEDILRQRQAFLYGIVSGQLAPSKKDTEEVWTFRPLFGDGYADVRPDANRTQKLGLPAQLRRGSYYYYALYLALDNHRKMVGDLLGSSKIQGRDDIYAYPRGEVSKHLFHKGCEGKERKFPPPLGAEEFAKRNIFDHIALLAAENQGNTQMQALGKGLLDACIGMVVDYFRDCYANNMYGTARAEAKKFLEGLAAASESIKKNNELYNYCMSKLASLERSGVGVGAVE